MECYEGAKMIKSFRGNLGDGAQDHIRIKTNKGDIGYRIVKFQTTMETWGGATTESVMKIYKLKQSSIDAKVDFTDGDLLASNVFSYNTSGNYAGDASNIIFDNEIFNQDIYITNKNAGGSVDPVNYYLELEQIKLNENESTMATLQSMRQIAER